MKKVKFLALMFLAGTTLFTSCKKDEKTENPSGGTLGEFTDARDGQIYKYVKIGNQTWMAENLNYVTANSWAYDDEPANGDVYGRLYIYDAALIACPSGWHLPSDEEWKTLEMALGMSQVHADSESWWRGTDEGGKMKEAVSSHWYLPNTGATNSSGFTALPGGYCDDDDGSFSLIGYNGFWWTSSEALGDYAWRRYLSYEYGQVYRDNGGWKPMGMSVRCIKD